MYQELAHCFLPSLLRLYCYQHVTFLEWAYFSVMNNVQTTVFDKVFHMYQIMKE